MAPTSSANIMPSAAESTIPMDVPTNSPAITVNATIDDLKIRFSEVQTISSADVFRLQVELEMWFEAYFNEEQQRKRYLPLRHQNRRTVQFRVPTLWNMRTIYIATTQDVSTILGSNIISFQQNMTYDSISTIINPEDYALLPFNDTFYTELLLEKLGTTIESFNEISEVFAAFIIEPYAYEDFGLSVGAIVGVVIAAIIGLLLVAGAGYFLGKQVVDRPSPEKNVKEMDDRSNHDNEHANTIGETQSPAGNLHIIPANVPNALDANCQYIHSPIQSNDYVVTYKDQSRSVVGPTPIVQAIPELKNQKQDDGAIPIASVVPRSTHRPQLFFEA